MSEHDERADEVPEFGPGGYLPDRASRRARKIVLRAPLGLQWVVGAVLVGLVVVVAGWFALRDTTPAPPFERLPAALVDATRADVQRWQPEGTDGGAIVVTDGPRPRVFAWDHAEVPVLCDTSGLLEGVDGAAWRRTGRGVGGTPSLAEHPVVIHDGAVYVDPTTAVPAPVASDDPVELRCR